MSIRELVAKLAQVPNQDAEVAVQVVGLVVGTTRRVSLQTGEPATS